MASSDQKGLYLRLDTGAGFAGSTNTSGTTPIVDAGIGYRFNRHLRSDITVGYNGSYQLNGFSAVNPNSGNTISTGKADYDSTAVLVNVYYDITKINRFTPYVGGGVGMSFTSVNAPTLSINGSPVGTGSSSSSSDFAWQLALGTGVDITKNISLDIGYRYAYLGSLNQNNDFSPYGENAIITRTGNLYAHELQAGMRYRF
jgi:opacity protein-like surface antigen